MSELNTDAIAAIRAALGRLIEDYDGAGINAGTTRQVAEALTASNIMKLLRAYDELSAPAVAEPVAWQQTTADGEPLWRYDSFSSTPDQFDYSRPLYAKPRPSHTSAADDVRAALVDDWLRSRGAIIEALEKAGLCLWSNAEGFWIAPTPAAARDATRLEWFLRSRSDMPPTIEAWRAAVDAAMKP